MKFKILIGLSMALVSMAFVINKANEPKKGYSSLNMNNSVHACDNFYEYAVGGWMKNNPIPNTESRWGAFNILQKENEIKLKNILDDIINPADPKATYKKGSNEQLLGDFYKSTLDTLTINKLGHTPILNEWKKIDALKKIQDLGILQLDIPKLPIFASTQTDNYKLERIKFLDSLGFKRSLCKARQRSQ